MTTHIKAFTYKPKIKAVQAGTCTQTIRLRGIDPVEIGDYILFHGWSGKPYKSEWSWRLKVRVTEVWNVFMRTDGIIPPDWPPRLIAWTDPFVNDIAKRDGIKPPTGEALFQLLNKMYKLEKSADAFQIIRWIVLPAKSATMLSDFGVE